MCDTRIKISLADLPYQSGEIFPVVSSAFLLHSLQAAFTLVRKLHYYHALKFYLA